MHARNLLVTSLAAVGLGALTLVSTPALAATELHVPGTKDTVVSDEKLDRPGPYKAQEIQVNPLSLAIGRISVGYTFMPAIHHALLINPHFQRATNDTALDGNTTYSSSYSGFGGEVGYRYYTGHRGMDGFFVGPSILAGVYNASLPNGQQAFTNYGLAVDAGAQTFLTDNITVGAGVGLEYLKVNKEFGDLPFSASSIATTGFKPRLLASAGYAF